MTEPSLFADDAVLTAKSVLGSHKNPLVSISGGSDSDVMLDVIREAEQLDRCSFVFCNTGLEYRATIDHLDYLEDRYGIKIDRIRADNPVPRVVRQYGQPIVSKHASEMISRLQNVGFDWSDDRPLDALTKDYGIIQPFKWWTDYYQNNPDYRSIFSISRNSGLKEYLMLNPPTFKVSNRCCDKSKKAVFKKALDSFDCDLNVIGVRRQEGGVRAATKTCFSKNVKGISTYRPIFWFSNRDKDDWCRCHGIVHSDCYTRYGLVRTGCTGCPYGLHVLSSIARVRKYEPRIIHAAECTFGKAYDWTAGYRRFQKVHTAREKADRQGIRCLDEFAEDSL